MFLGFSEGFHDAGVAVISGEGKIAFATHAERFSRVKHDKHIGSSLRDYIERGYNITHRAFYEKPLLKKTRQLYAGQYKTVFTPRQLAWKPDSTWHHHKSHAAAAFQTSNFDHAAAVVIDSIGEWDCTSIWECFYDQKTGKVKYTKRYSEEYPTSLGLWYSALTAYCGLRPLDEEYIFMGMAAYGKLNLQCRSAVNKLRFSNNHRGITSGVLDKFTHEDIAYNAQKCLEGRVSNFVNMAANLVGTNNIVYGGGVALNCVANAKLYEQFPDMWIMPNPGDAGGALGAACLAYGKKVTWAGPYLGRDISSHRHPRDIAEEVVDELIANGICGVAHGRSEYGPRALGNRSLLADPRSDAMKDKVNEIKRRQKFRPFAPAIMTDFVDTYFDGPKSDYMQSVAYLNDTFEGDFPAIIHADGSSRVQQVHPHSGTILRRILERWLVRTGCPMLLNTSLNIRGEPMVDTIQHAAAFEQMYGVKVIS
tara:strand:- start:8880 stop:10316 length:1437 start_codon:yes stop_codon:yes gene_type:complete